MPDNPFSSTRPKRFPVPVQPRSQVSDHVDSAQVIGTAYAKLLEDAATAVRQLVAAEAIPSAVYDYRAGFVLPSGNKVG